MKSKKPAIGVILIIIIIGGLFSIHKYLNFTYGTYLNSGISFSTGEGTMGELKSMFTGGDWTKAIYKMGNLEQEYEKAHEINSGTAGWIFIDGTNINYPVMHGEVDEYYLTHNWKGQPYWNGSIFLDHANSGFNNVSLINGHNMLNGIMFSQLTNFKNKDFFDGNHDIYLYDGLDHKLEEFKAIGALYCEPTIDLSLGNLSTENRTNEVNQLLSKSMYPKEIYNGNDVLLLNTCLSNGSGKHILVVAEEIENQNA